MGGLTLSIYGWFMALLTLDYGCPIGNSWAHRPTSTNRLRRQASEGAKDRLRSPTVRASTVLPSASSPHEDSRISGAKKFPIPDANLGAGIFTYKTR
jgi:hypothetical protein